MRIIKLAKDFKPQFNNKEEFHRRLREDINSTLEPVELESRRTRIIAQIRQEQLTRVAPVKVRPTGFRLSPYMVGGLATLLLAVGLVLYSLLSTQSQTFNDVAQKLPTAGLAASSNESSVSDSAAGAPKAAIPNTTAAATTIAAAAVGQATTAAAPTLAAATTAAATTAAAGVAPQPTFAPNFFTASELWLQYPASQPITAVNQLALDYLRKLTTALTENDKLRTGLIEPLGFNQYRALRVSGLSVDSVAQYYRTAAIQHNLKLEAISASATGNISWQWLYLNGANAPYGVLIVEFKENAPNPFGNGNINRGEILILIAS
jgi:hypothetical protein